MVEQQRQLLQQRQQQQYVNKSALFAEAQECVVCRRTRVRCFLFYHVCCAPGSRGGWTRACNWRGIRGGDTASVSIVRAVYLIGCALSRWSKQICRQRAQSVCWASGLLRPDSSYCWDLSMDVENACDFAIIAGRNAWRMFCASQL